MGSVVAKSVRTSASGPLVHGGMRSTSISDAATDVLRRAVACLTSVGPTVLLPWARKGFVGSLREPRKERMRPTKQDMW